MSLNTSHNGCGVILYYGERILLFYDGVEMKLEEPSNIVHFKGSKKGRIFLTTHRIIFINNNPKDTLQSFSAAFLSLCELELEQPIFGANFIKGFVQAEANGNWDGRSKIKLWFNKGGAIEFGRAMLECGRRASRVAQQMPPPPPYTPPTDFYPADFNQYGPPNGSDYGFVPYSHFPDQPPADSVYMATAPPPYPGIAPISPADAKAQEAQQGQAYYQNGDGHNMYMQNASAPAYASAPAPAYADAPPAYNDINKKDQ